MHAKVLFSETQYFRQWWVWVILIGVDVLFAYALVSQVFFETSFGDKPMTNGGIIITFIMVVLITLLFALMRLHIEIREDGIYYAFFPFYFSMHHKPWSDINKVYVRQYNALTEFGGWGVRYSVAGRGRALNVRGNMGIQMELVNGRRFLLGIQKADEAQQALKNAGKYAAPEIDNG